MHPIKSAIFVVFALSILTPLLPGSEALAAIKCDGPYQVIKNYGKISTPYCGDNYLAAVARGYGMKVSNRAMRYKPQIKWEACRLYGYDSRVVDICYGFRDGDRLHH